VFMSVFAQVLKEIAHRKINFLLALIAVTCAVLFFVSFYTTAQASGRETARLMRNLGFNIRIVPRETDLERFWMRGYSTETMPEEYVYRFAGQEGLSFARLTAILQQPVEVRGIQALLTGLSAEVKPAGTPPAIMTFQIEPGTVYAGSELVAVLGLEEGDELAVGDLPFRVERCLSESGSVDDIRLYCALADAQSILGLPGRINEIKAMDCACLIPGGDSKAQLESELERMLPEGRLVRIQNLATAREEQRKVIEGYVALLIPFVVGLCGVWIGALAMLNVRERRTEIGILRALGYGGGRISALILLKAICIGLIGAVIGYAIGTWLALTQGPHLFKLTASGIVPIAWLFWWTLLLAPLFTAISSLIPMVLAVTEDPAETLREN
jgi:putative ABC transport system permease protein